MIDFTNTQVDHQELPRLQTLDLLPLEQRYKKIMYVNLLSTLLLPVGWIASLFIFDLKNTIWLAGLLAIPAFFIPLLNFLLVSPSFSVKKFAIREKDVLYQSGLIFRSLTIVPFNRVQHCEINRGPLSRLFGLSELHIFTAGGSSSDILIPGLAEDTAEQMCQYILNKIEQSDEEE